VFTKILIANRGEIACRVIRTARRLGIATVAVYSEADRGALHVEMADEARLIGPAPAWQSYLKAEAVIAAARDSGAEAVHPGYGFLAENADFAEACAAAGLVFIGPSPAAIRAMGSKSASKDLMIAHGVPVVPGYHGADQDPARLFAEAERIGFPVLIKASGGGGGRGMRIVAGAGDFARALDGARREAKGAFGDDRVLIERYLSAPRHIEIQVFGDTHGNIVHLFERDCSIQRRHQKVVEEAPAPGIDPARRAAMGAAAVAAAASVSYVGAGTVEFIVEGDRFYFMEMNTRLQVEHPVTEMITGIDLVEWQLRVAAGQSLPVSQQDIDLNGHAIEVRLYAENPQRGFLPATGTLHGLRFPGGEGVRVDSGVRQGDAVTPFYDPMIAKIIAHGIDRDEARSRLGRALADTAMQGITTNLGFLARIVDDPEFAAGAIDTGFIERRREALIPPPSVVPPVALAAASLHRLLSAQQMSGAETLGPWGRRDGWRLNGPNAPQPLVFRSGTESLSVIATAAAEGWRLDIGGHCYRAEATRGAAGSYAVTLDGTRTRAIVFEHAGELAVFVACENWRLDIVDPLAPPEGTDMAAGLLTAPMPGRVVQLLVESGATVRRGQPLMVIEAMKMEHTIAAPRDGTVASVPFAVGDPVEEGVELIALTPVEPGSRG